MGFAQFNRYKLVKTFDTDEVALIAIFSDEVNRELTNIKQEVFLKGTFTAERFRLKIYSRDDLDGLIVASSWVSISDIDVTANWIGVVRFDFARTFLNKDVTYYLALEVDDYTRNGDTLYISAVLDQIPQEVVNTISGSGTPSRFHLYGYTEKRL